MAGGALETDLVSQSVHRPDWTVERDPNPPPQKKQKRRSAAVERAQERSRKITKYTCAILLVLCSHYNFVVPPGRTVAPDRTIHGWIHPPPTHRDASVTAYLRVRRQNDPLSYPRTNSNHYQYQYGYCYRDRHPSGPTPGRKSDACWLACV